MCCNEKFSVDMSLDRSTIFETVENIVNCLTMVEMAALRKRLHAFGIDLRVTDTFWERYGVDDAKYMIYVPVMTPAEYDERFEQQGGEKIPMIRMIRQFTNWDLSESKKAMESLSRAPVVLYTGSEENCQRKLKQMRDEGQTSNPYHLTRIALA